MKKAAIEKQKIFDFIKSHQGISLDEIKRWGELDFIRGYVVNEFCRNLVREGLVETTLLADGVTLYSAVHKKVPADAGAGEEGETAVICPEA